VREEGLDIVGVPTSIATMELAIEVGIPLTSLSEAGQLDVVIDGTDEYDPYFTLIKGGGGALTREKVVAQSSNAMVVVADHRKKVDVLGAFPLPVEVLDFEWKRTMDRIGAICPGAVTLRGGSTPFVTDNGGLILDCEFGPSITDPLALEAQILSIAGVVEVGLFCGLCDVVVLADNDSVIISARSDGRLS
jgi:ribose 5-phosphate isomerase A